MPFIPRHETLFLNLRSTPVEELQGSTVSYALQVLQVEDAPLEELHRVLAHALDSLEELPEENRAEWQSIMQFMLSLIRNRRAIDEQDELTTLVTEAVRPEHKEEVEEMVMTGAEYLWRQGRKEGRKEGREEGLRIGQSELLLTLLQDKFGKLPMDVVTAVKAMPLARLKELAHQILTAQQLSDLHLNVENA